MWDREVVRYRKWFNKLNLVLEKRFRFVGLWVRILIRLCRTGSWFRLVKVGRFQQLGSLSRECDDIRRIWPQMWNLHKSFGSNTVVGLNILGFKPVEDQARHFGRFGPAERVPYGPGGVWTDPKTQTKIRAHHRILSLQARTWVRATTIRRERSDV